MAKKLFFSKSRKLTDKSVSEKECSELEKAPGNVGFLMYA